MQSTRDELHFLSFLGDLDMCCANVSMYVWLTTKVAIPAYSVK